MKSGCIIHHGSSSAAWGLWVSHSGAAEIQERGLTNMLARSLIGEASRLPDAKTPKWKDFVDFFGGGISALVAGNSDTVVFSCLASQYVFKGICSNKMI